jgi:hypothetical protein
VVSVGLALHPWRGAKAGLALAAGLLIHGAAAALGYRWLRRRERMPEADEH